MTSKSVVHHSVLWRQVWGVAALLAAILFGFMVYGVYQAQILTDLGFTPMASLLGVVQGGLGILVEPVIGGISDTILRRVGSRLPLVAVGVTVAGLIFVLAALLLQGQPLGGWHWLVPLLMIGWLTAMIAVRGPIVALLRQFAPTAALPQANAILVFVLTITGALGPLLSFLAQWMGVSLAFVLGAIVLILGAIILFSTTPHHSLPILAELPTQSMPRSHLLGTSFRVFIVGWGTGIEINLMLAYSPLVLHQTLGIDSPWMLSSVILAIAAVAANPMGQFITHWGTARSLQLGLGTISLGMGLLLLNPNFFLAGALTLGLSVTLGLVFISMVPFALEAWPPHQAGLGAGLYFGGMSAASATLASLELMRGSPSLTEAVVWSAIAALISSSLAKKTSDFGNPRC